MKPDPYPYHVEVAELTPRHLASTHMGFVPCAKGFVGDIDVAWMRECGDSEHKIDYVCFENLKDRLADRVSQHVTLDIG